MKREKKTVFSGIQPSGIITLGNYLGAIKNWVRLQDDFNCIFFLADLHTITVRQDPKNFHENILQAYALLLACGIDPEKSLFFIQSHVDTHAQLSWILNCFTQFGELSRMTQFKDKSKKYPENINAGLFTYPCLMTADILLYQADYIPTGKDQKQHVELTRNIAERFNSIYGQTFKVPEPYIEKTGSNIMSLADPSKKMSKSDINENACITILDTPEDIMKKFKRSVTDSESEICYREDKKGISNLMGIYNCITGKSFQKIEDEFKGKGYGDLKRAVGKAVVEELTPIQHRYREFINDKAYLESCYKAAAIKAKQISEVTLNTVMDKIGFLRF